jgi:hypothetical protein
MVDSLLALLLMLWALRKLLRITFPRFSYSPLIKGTKILWRLPKSTGGKTIGKWLYKLLYKNQKEKRGRSFALFHFSLLGSILSTVVYFMYGEDLRVVLIMWFVAGLLWKVHGWIKGATRRPLPGRQRR